MTTVSRRTRVGRRSDSDGLLPTSSNGRSRSGSGADVSLAFDTTAKDRRDASRRTRAGLSFMPFEDATFSYVFFALFLLAVAFLVSVRLNALPPPVDNRNVTDPADLLQFSEARAREHIKYMASVIGGRMTGSIGEKWTQDYITGELESLWERSQSLGFGDGLSLDVHVQRPSGSHKFYMAGMYVNKHFKNVTNVVAVLTPAGYVPDPLNPRGILFNAHTDTTTGTTGAGDDAAGVAILLEVARVLFNDGEFRKAMRNQIVLLFNGAEESLQDASYGFMKTHPLVPSLKAVVNLEACGQGGPEALFQANSPGMVRAYARSARWPHGSVMANDVFRTGVLVSDTDFRQFIDYGHERLVGIDMAYYTNSEIYHTMLDTEERMTPGSVQHFGDNVLGLARYLAQEEHFDESNGYTRGFDAVYTDLFGFTEVVFSTSAMQAVHTVLILASLATLAGLLHHDLPRRPAPNSELLAFGVAVLALVLALPLSVLGGALSASSVWLSGGYLLSWFKTGGLGLVAMYSWGALLGLYGAQYLSGALTRRLARGGYPTDPAAAERRVLLAELALFNAILVVGTYYGVGTTWMTGLRVACLLGAIWMAEWRDRAEGGRGLAPVGAYFVAWTLPFAWDAFFFLPAFYILLPLMGRSGAGVPSELITGAVLMGAAVWLALSPLNAFMHRFGGERHIVRSIAVLGVAAVVVPTVISRLVFPFDATHHPKHLVVLLSDNVTDESDAGKWLTVSRMDFEPAGFEEAVKSLDERIGWGKDDVRPREIVPGLDAHVFFPLNSFIRGVKYPYEAVRPLIPANETRRALGMPAPRPAPNVTLINSTYHLVNHTRKINMRVHQAGMGWSSITFTADVTEWSFDIPLGDPGVRMHVVRNAMGHGVDDWDVEVVVKCPAGLKPNDCARWRLPVHFWGYDNRMWNVIGRPGDWGVQGDTDWFEEAGLAWDEGEILRAMRKALPDWVTLSLGSVVGGTWFV